MKIIFIYKKKDTSKVNVLSRFMAMSFTVREFSCKALKEFQKSCFSMNYECLVLIQKNKGLEPNISRPTLALS